MTLYSRPVQRVSVAISRADVRKDVAEVVADADTWLATPNDLFFGESPSEVIDKGEGQRVLDLMAAIKHGLPY